MKTKIIAVLSMALLLSACHTMRTTDVENFPYEKLPLKGKSTKEGKACAEYTFITSFFSDFDISVETAKKNGNITEIVTVEKEVAMRPGFRSVCTIVRGN